MLLVIRAARAALGPGNDQHRPRSAAQPGFVILRRLTPAGKTDTETQSLKSGGIARSGPCSAAMGLHFDLDADGKATTCRTATTSRSDCQISTGPVT
jgi:hypothetical protein